jgi:hypothetical protein
MFMNSQLDSVDCPAMVTGYTGDIECYSIGEARNVMLDLPQNNCAFSVCIVTTIID